MVSWGSGLLAVVGGAGEGAGNTIKEQAKDERIASIEEKKAEALLLRQKNLARYQSDLQASRDESHMAHDSKESSLDRDFKSKESLLNRNFDSEEAGFDRSFKSNEGALNRGFDAEQTRLQADLGLRNAKAMAAYSASFKTTSPTEIEQKYNFLAQTFGEEKAKELVMSSMDRGTNGENALDNRKLWNKAYNDQLDISTSTVNDNRPYKEKVEEAKAIADMVSGVKLSNSTEGGKGSENPFDKYHNDYNAARKNTDTDQEPKHAGTNVFKALKSSGGQYNPSDGTITFIPKDEDDLKRIFLDISGQGIKFDAHQDSTGKFVLEIKNNAKMEK